MSLTSIWHPIDVLPMSKHYKIYLADVKADCPIDVSVMYSTCAIRGAFIHLCYQLLCVVLNVDKSLSKATNVKCLFMYLHYFLHTFQVVNCENFVLFEIFSRVWSIGKQMCRFEAKRDTAMASKASWACAHQYCLNNNYCFWIIVRGRFRH